MDLHGTINVESALGQGTRFVMDIPAAKLIFTSAHSS
jgi:chemotaxis protein histidine kinase CheA